MLTVKENEYRIIKLPKDLTDLIDQMMGKMGYKTRTEFVKDAVRRLLETYGIPQRVENKQAI